MKGNYRIYPDFKMVYEFAHAMSRTETLRFRHTAKGTKEDPDKLAYVRFYNVLIDAPKFDAKAIKHRLRNTTTLNRFGDALCYLYHAMLAAAQATDANLTKDVSDLNMQIQVLLQKGLHHHVHKLYEQAVKFARDLEDFEGELKLLRLRRSIHFHNFKGNVLVLALSVLQDQEARAWAKMANLREWESLLTIRFIAKAQADPERQATLKTIFDHPLFAADAGCMSVKAEITKLTLQEKLLAMDKLDVPERLPILLQLSTLIAAHPALLEDPLVLERYLFATYNAGLIGLTMRNEGIMRQAIGRLETLATLRPVATVLVFERAEKLKLDWVLDELDIQNAVPVVEAAKLGLERYGERIQYKHRLELGRNICFYYLVSGNASAAVKFLLPRLEADPLPEAPQWNLLGWILFLIAHYDLGNKDVVHSQATYAKRYMLEHDLIDPFATALFSFFQELPIDNDAKAVATMQLFLPTLAHELGQAHNRFYEITFPLASWVASKAEQPDLLSRLLLAKS